MTESFLKKSYYLATWIIALTAVIGFLFSWCSSRETSKRLNDFGKAIDNFTEPVIQFNRINLFFLRNHERDCDNPPFGINAIYVNQSNIPIKVTNPSLITSIGGVVVNEKKMEIGQDSLFVLTPGEPLGMTAQGKLFEVFRNKKVMYDPPFIELKLNATISTLNESKKYKVTLIDNIGLTCSDWDNRNHFTVKESFESVE